jgi:RHS repeat-associated protein
LRARAVAFRLAVAVGLAALPDPASAQAPITQDPAYAWRGDHVLNLVRSDESNPYFRIVPSVGDGSSDLLARRNRFGFTGHYFDHETGLYFARSRYLDPRFGRFITQDSYLGAADRPPSLHRYFYANANPTRFIDPDGHASRVIETHPRRTGFTVTPEGYTQALTYETAVTVMDDQPAAYALPQAVGRRVAPLNRAAETGLRATGVALQATAAATLAVAPEPTGLTKAGAVYFGARALDEGQALARELATGTPTTSLAHQGVSTLYAATGDDARTASLKASLTLAGADLAFGVGAGVSAVRAGGRTGVIEGTVVEGHSELLISNQLRVLNPHFTPNDPTRVLQNITTAKAEELAANPALAQQFLSRAEYAAGQRSAPVARLNMGKAVERSVADEISEFAPHRQLFSYASGPYRPDFTGVPGGPAAGMNFDITTPGQVALHLARPGYGPGLNIVTYRRPPPFKLFP